MIEFTDPNDITPEIQSRPVLVEPLLHVTPVRARRG